MEPKPEIKIPKMAVSPEPMRPQGLPTEYNDESKETLIKWLTEGRETVFKIQSQCREAYRQNNGLETKLLQEQKKTQDLEKEINEYNKKMGIMEQEPIDTNDYIENTRILPPIDKLSDYQIYKNQQDNIVYRKKVFKQIKNNDDKNSVEFDECCICYEENNSFKLKTNCKHDICMSCILKINKKECPMCREPFPEEITKLLNKESGYSSAYSSEPRGIDNLFSWSGVPMPTGYFL